MDYIYFYDLYENYNMINNKIFGFIYRIRHYCNGKCKLSSQLNDELISKAFIDISLVAFEDNRCNTIDN